MIARRGAPALLVSSALACSGTQSNDAALAAGAFMPPHIQTACAMTARTCARCHDLGKVRITHFDHSLPWRQLVLRMRRLPGSGITDDEVHAAETCLVYHDLGRRGLDELATLTDKTDKAETK